MDCMYTMCEIRHRADLRSAAAIIFLQTGEKWAKIKRSQRGQIEKKQWKTDIS